MEDIAGIVEPFCFSIHASEMEGCPLLEFGMWRNIIFREIKKLMLVISDVSDILVT